VLGIKWHRNIYTVYCLKILRMKSCDILNSCIPKQS